MYYLIFKNGKACGMTTWTNFALKQKAEEGWEVEAHDDWPEQRNHFDLLRCDFTGKNLPEKVANYTVDRFFEKFIDDD